MLGLALRAVRQAAQAVPERVDLGLAILLAALASAAPLERWHDLSAGVSAMVPNGSAVFTLAANFSISLPLVTINITQGRKLTLNSNGGVLDGRLSARLFRVGQHSELRLNGPMTLSRASTRADTELLQCSGSSDEKRNCGGECGWCWGYGGAISAFQQ